jgi:hypothetical protein
MPLRSSRRGRAPARASGFDDGVLRLYMMQNPVLGSRDRVCERVNPGSTARDKRPRLIATRLTSSATC